MAQSGGRVRKPRVRTLSRLWLVLLVGFAAVTGYAGLWRYRSPERPTIGAALDILYYDLQLFVLEFDSVDGASVPFLLHIARIVAPAATAVAAAFAIVGASWWLRRTTARGYAIVVGDTALARAVAQAKRAASGRAVFEIDNGDPASLRAAGVRRARVVYACGDDREDVAANVATALAALAATKSGGPRIHAQVSDPDLAVGLRARRLMSAAAERVEFFSMDELAARAHVTQEVWDIPGSETSDAWAPHVLVAGAGAFGCGVIIELARRWRHRPGTLTVTLVDGDAARAKERLLDAWPVVAGKCQIVAIESNSLVEALRRSDVERPDRAYICYEDDHLALRAALSAMPLWHGGPGSLVVRLSQLARLSEAFAGGQLLDDIDGRLVVADVAALCAKQVVEDRDIYWELAPAVHARYLAAALRKGDALGSSASLQPWERLNQDFKDSNYDQARHLARKLTEVGATVAPRSAANRPFALSEAEVERLAPMEHERWVRDRAAHRWKYGPKRDNARKLHPDMVPWAQLSDESQERDRSAVRGLPEEYDEVLAEFGLQIVRFESRRPAVPAQQVAVGS